MPGLLRAVGRTAVIAGTATHVSNNVSRRQQNRWAEKDQQAYDAQAYEQQQYAPPPPQYAPAPVQYAPAPPAPAPAAAAPEADLTAQLAQLGSLHSSGVLSDAEFTSAKAKLLGL
jgi:hypothetical protein